MKVVDFGKRVFPLSSNRAEHLKGDFAYVSSLRDCAKKKDLHTGSRLHEEILRRGLHGPRLISALINMYVQCGVLATAKQVLEEFPGRNIFSWNTLIAGYAQHGCGHDALKLYEQMQIEGLSPDTITFTCILKVCGDMEALDEGRTIHGKLMGQGMLENDIVLGNALVDMYAKCGKLAKAQEILEELPLRDVVSWNILIAAYTRHNECHKALNCFEQMKSEGISPDVVTFVNTLMACARTRAIDKCKNIQSNIVSRDLLLKDVVLGTALIDMYAKCGLLVEARHFLQELSIRNIVSWNALLAGYAEQDQCIEVFECFGRMKLEGFSPDMVTFISVLKACSNRMAVYKGKQIHVEILVRGISNKDIVLSTSLIDMYAKCGMLEKAREMLDMCLAHDVISWNALIGGYIQHGECGEVLNCFHRMQTEGLCPSATTFICSLEACGSARALDKGKQIHIEIMMRGLLEKNIMIGTALMDMYTKCRMFTKSLEVFEELPTRSIVSWNTLITGYGQEDKHEDVLMCFQCMHHEGISPDCVSFIFILKACANTGAIDEGKKIHNLIVSLSLLDDNAILGNALVQMYGKCGIHADAHKMLTQLPDRDTATWNAVIIGYLKERKCYEVFNCFEAMQREGLSPNSTTLIFILKACSFVGIANMSKHIEDELVCRSCWKKDIILGNVLIDTFMRSGELVRAQYVFDELLFHDVASWNVLVAGYAEHGLSHHALKWFEQMQNEGLFPDPVTYIHILKVCGRMGAVKRGKQLHNDIISQDLLTKDVVIGNSLLDMYVKCDMLEKAKEVLQELAVRNEVSWSSLIGGYTRQGHSSAALDCFQRMQSDGLSPDVVTFICILKSCGILGAAVKGKQIHAVILMGDLLKCNITLGNSLVNMYIKCGLISEAQKVIQELPVRDVVSWNTLIAGCAQQAQSQKALNYFEGIQSDGIIPDTVTFMCTLKACSSIGAIDIGKHIHEEVMYMGFHYEDALLGSSLIDMYAKCGMPANAWQVLEELPIRSVACWNALITGYAREGKCYEAVDCFKHMQIEGHSPDAVTFICVLKACSNPSMMHMGEQIHEKIVDDRLLERDIAVGSTLVNMYAKCGELAKAEELHRVLPFRNAVSWNALIAGYAEHRRVQQAFDCLERMENESISPDIVTFISLLRACGSRRAISEGKEIHAEIVRRGLPSKETMLGSALIGMYAKCGALYKAQTVLKELPVGDITPWNALIAGYAQQGNGTEAISCFECLKRTQLSPDAITFISILKACASIGAVDYGKHVHSQILDMGILDKDIVVGTVLVDMYAKFGMLINATEVLEELPIRDTVTWNALIAGLAQQGRGHEAVNCLQQLQHEGLFPDDITLLCVLTACSHSGLWNEAQMHFVQLTIKYGIAPNIQHHTSMLMAFGCSGHLEDIFSMIKELPSFDLPAVRLALLSVCRQWGNEELGRLAFHHLDEECHRLYEVQV